MKNPELCEVCGEGHLSQVVEGVEVEYKGTKRLLPTHSSVCDVCGSDYTTSANLRFNKRQMIAFEKSIDGLLSGDQIRAFREQFHLSQEQAAKILGGGPIAFCKYESNDVAQSASMDNLLRSAMEFPLVLAFLAERAGLAEVAMRLRGQCDVQAVRPPLAELGRDRLFADACIVSAAIHRDVQEQLVVAYKALNALAPVEPAVHRVVEWTTAEDVLATSLELAGGNIYGKLVHAGSGFRDESSEDFGLSNVPHFQTVKYQNQRRR